jgi:hypothetical protein
LRRKEGIVATPEPMAMERVGSVALQGKVYPPCEASKVNKDLNNIACIQQGQLIFALAKSW